MEYELWYQRNQSLLEANLRVINEGNKVKIDMGWEEDEFFKIDDPEDGLKDKNGEKKNRLMAGEDGD